MWWGSCFTVLVSHSRALHNINYTYKIWFPLDTSFSTLHQTHLAFVTSNVARDPTRPCGNMRAHINNDRVWTPFFGVKPKRPHCDCELYCVFMRKTMVNHWHRIEYRCIAINRSSDYQTNLLWEGGVCGRHVSVPADLIDPDFGWHCANVSSMRCRL